MLVLSAVTVGAIANVCIFRLTSLVPAEMADATIGMMETTGNLLAFVLPLLFVLFADSVRLVPVLLAGLSGLSALIVFVLFLMRKS